MGKIIGQVSLWLAKVSDQESLNIFLETAYLEDETYQNSIFGNYFETGYYNESFREADILEKYSNNLGYLIEGFSYDEVIIPRFRKIVLELDNNFNTVIMLYNYHYHGRLKVYSSQYIYCQFLSCVSYI